MPQLHEFCYPDESDAYRAARNTLLEAERWYRRATEGLAGLQPVLPHGGQVPEGYPFVDRPGGRVSMLELSGTTHDTLVLYSFIYRTQLTPRPMCAVYLDSLNGNLQHLARTSQLRPSPRQNWWSWMPLPPRRMGTRCNRWSVEKPAMASRVVEKIVMSSSCPSCLCSVSRSKACATFMERSCSSRHRRTANIRDIWILCGRYGTSSTQRLLGGRRNGNRHFTIDASTPRKGTFGHRMQLAFPITREAKRLQQC